MGSNVRKIVSLRASITTGPLNSSGFIENLSRDSLYLTVVPPAPFTDLVPGAIVEIRFQPESMNRTMNITGKVKWSYKTPPHGITDSLGIDIIQPSPEYDEFIKALQ